MISVLTSLLDRTVQHQRATYTADAAGARSPSYATINADQKAAIWPMAAVPQIADAFERKDIVTSHAICFESDLGVKPKDIVTEGSDTYTAEGSMKYENRSIAAITVYVVAANLRIV